MRKCRRTRRRAQNSRSLQLEGLENRNLMAADAGLATTRPTGAAPQPPAPVPPEVRSLDGTGNNVAHPDWGSTDSEFLRQSPARYADGISAPGGANRASPRAISNLVAAQTGSVTNDRNLSDMVWQWGQFLDHDLDLTGTADPAESFPIAVPSGDPYFDPNGTGTATIPLSRSDYDPSSGTSRQNPRDQINSITAFIDGSQVYGSDAERAAGLRTLSGGKLRTSEGNLLPFNTTGLPNAGGPSSSLFVAGDIRVNEQVGLMAMHTLWVREHNRIADRLAAQFPQLNDEQLYQSARSIVTGELQAITYNEFLPALLGRDALPAYRGYKPNVDPGISNLFATASYRFGHSMLSSEILRLNNDGQVIADGNLSLRDAFFNLGEVIENGVDSLLKGLASQTAQEIDTKVVDDVRNFLFGPPGAGGFDLASLNIQRGRDHGLPSYNEARVSMGLPAVRSFSQITSNPDTQRALSQAYDGDVNKIDVWVGGLAEDHVRGASVGPLVQRVLADQFTRVRDGDRFWYQKIFSGPLLREIEGTRLSDVIRRNTEITNIQPNAFVVPSGTSIPQLQANNTVAGQRLSAGPSGPTSRGTPPIRPATNPSGATSSPTVSAASQTPATSASRSRPTHATQANSIPQSADEVFRQLGRI